jgi:WXG100 family type VII secretion target
MANMNVTYDDMETAARQLQSGQSQLEDKLKELKGLVDTLVNGGYVTDSSSKAFDASYVEFNRGVNDAVAGLEGMSQYLTAAANALRSTDEELAKALR